MYEPAIPIDLAVPFQDLYGTLLNDSSGNRGWADANGLSSNFHTDFPFVFDSWPEAELGILHAVPSFKALRTNFPRVFYLNGMVAKSHRNPFVFPETVAAGAAGAVVIQHAEAYAELRDGPARALWEREREDMELRLVTPDRQFFSYQAMAVANASQYHADFRNRYAKTALEHLHKLTAFLNGEMARLSTPTTQAHWSVRPPHTFTNAVNTNPSQIPSRFFDEPTLYTTAAQQAIAELLGTQGLYSEMFHPRQEDTESLEPAIQEYFRWWKMMATAIFTHPTKPYSIAIVPAGTPPFMFRNPNVTAPIYVARPLHRLCVSDSCYLIRNVYQEEAGDGLDALLEGSTAAIDDMLPIAIAMQLVLMNLHIVTCSLSVGKGNRKPQWLQSPPNIPFVHITRMATLDFFEQLAFIGL